VKPVDAPAYADKLAGTGHAKQSLRLWLRLLSCSTVIEKRIRARLDTEFGTTLPRFDVLAALDRHPDGMTLTALSTALMVSNGNVTGVVARLIEDGLVSRQVHAADRRSATVRLTRKGRASFERMAAAHESWIDDYLGRLTNAQIDALMDLLGRLRLSVEQQEEPPGPPVACG